MCDYCGCRGRAPVEGFGHDHERIGLLVASLEQALRSGTRDDEARAELLSLLARHGAAEEGGLYRELAVIGIDTARMEAEHDDVDQALASDDPAVVLPALARLRAHIHAEEYDLFPAAHQLLDDDAWQRVADAGEGSPRT